MTTNADGAGLARTQVESALAEYPDISRERLDALIAWFHKEASALDVAMIASNQHIADRYRRFREDHIDRLRPRDAIRAILFAAAIGAVVVLILWRAF